MPLPENNAGNLWRKVKTFLFGLAFLFILAGILYLKYGREDEGVVLVVDRIDLGAAGDFSGEPDRQNWVICFSMEANGKENHILVDGLYGDYFTGLLNSKPIYPDLKMQHIEDAAECLHSLRIDPDPGTVCDGQPEIVVSGNLNVDREKNFWGNGQLHKTDLAMGSGMWSYTLHYHYELPEGYEF